MTKHLKRPLSVLLAVMMIVSAFAALPVIADAKVAKSGSTLTLSGTFTLADLTGTGSIKATEKKNITKITAARNTKFTSTSTASMFKSYPNCQSIDLSNVSFSSWVDASSMFEGLSKLENLTLSKLNLTDANSMFKGCSLLKEIDVSALNTRNTNFKTMSNMFSGCAELKNIEFGDSFFTGYATSMSNMFKDCSSLETLDISSFDTSKCGTMYYMFSGCKNLRTLTVGDNFKSDSCTQINHMFANCSSLESVDVSHFDTQKATTMQSMFTGCSSLTSLDVSGFNTSNVWNLADMFSGCSSLTSLDVSGFNTSNVTDMADMFNGCSSLTSLDVSGFDTSKAVWAEKIFKDCSSLTELDLSSFVENNSAVENNDYVDLFSGCEALDKVTLSDKFSIREAMALTNVKDDYTGWAKENTSDIVSGEGEYAAFSGAGTYVRSAAVTPKVYTVTWNNSDGSLIDTTSVTEGDIPTHENPTKPGDYDNSYMFTGWTPGIKEAAGDVTYTATYRRAPINYEDDKYIYPDDKINVADDDEGKTNFGLNLDEYFNFQMLGVQLKKSIATEGGSDGIRFVTAVNSKLLKGNKIEDYGYIVVKAKEDTPVDKIYENMSKLTYGAVDENVNVFSCKGSSNTISGEFGKFDSDTDYKYVTLAVTGTDGSADTVAARFYVKTTDGKYHYADYVKPSETHIGMAFNLASVIGGLK